MGVHSEPLAGVGDWIMLVGGIVVEREGGRDWVETERGRGWVETERGRGCTTI